MSFFMWFSYRKRLDQKIKINFKIYDIITWETNKTIVVLILPNGSRSKGNQTMKFGVFSLLSINYRI